jgi:hypothetical protein
VTRVLLVVAVVACVSALARAQQPGPVPSVVLAGRVVAIGTSDSLRGARVTVVSNGRSQDPVFTDLRGAFRTVVPLGSVTLEIAKAGFATVRVTSSVQTSRSGVVQPVEVELAKGGVITGRVFDETGAPAVDARVHAELLSSQSGPTGLPGGPGNARTDDLGEYRIAGLQPGRYSVRALPRMSNASIMYQGPVPVAPDGSTLRDALAAAKAELDQTNPAAVLVDVVEGAEVSVVHPPFAAATTVNVTAGGASARMLYLFTDGAYTPGGVVTGSVTDQFGEPVSGLSVELRPLQVQSLRHVLGSGIRPRVTDDRGQFRLFGIPEGTYYLAVTASPSSPSTYAAVYYPGRSRLAEAIALRIEQGQELAGMNVTLALDRTTRIRGTVLDRAGRTGVVGSAVLSAVVPGGIMSLPREEASIDSGGDFELADVEPGDYLLQVSGKGSSGVRELGLEYVTVSGPEVGPVIVSTSSGSKVSGRVSIEMEGPIPATVGLSVAPADPAYAAMSTLYDGGFISGGRFELSNVIGPARLALEGAPPGWWLRSITIGGTDLTDAQIVFGREDRNDLVVVIGTRGGEVRGQLSGGTGSLLWQTSVAVFAVDSARWFYRSRFLRLVRAAPDGRFSVTGLPPGDYWVAPVESAIEESAYNAWQHPDFLNGLIPGATRLTLGEAQSATVALQLGGRRP